MVVEIPLTQGRVALVDDEDADRVIAAGPWHAYRNKKTWYAKHTVCVAKGAWQSIPLHRFILGAGPEAPSIDHINGNGLDNCRKNLRHCTTAENLCNARKRRGTSSRYKGVYLDVASGKWKAQAQVHGRRISLGRFDSEIDAAEAYDAAARRHYGEFARTNFRL